MDGPFPRPRLVPAQVLLTPEDTETIETDSVEILDELLTFEDAFAGGNYSRLGQLDSAYRSWNEDGEHDVTSGEAEGS